MTFPYGTVLRDTTDEEVVMVVCGRDDLPYGDVVILVESNARQPGGLVQLVGTVVFRTISGPQWERLE